MSTRDRILLGVLGTSVACLLMYAFRLERKLPPGARADRVAVYKSRRRMILLRNGMNLKTYLIALGSTPVGSKDYEGDGKTPEGHYFIDYRNPKSRYHLSLHISYPNAADRAHAERYGVSAGGEIMIHGQPNGLVQSGGYRQSGDWTAGCIAVSNDDIEEIWRVVPDGTPIDILP